LATLVRSQGWAEVVSVTGDVDANTGVIANRDGDCIAGFKVVNGRGEAG